MNRDWTPEEKQEILLRQQKQLAQIRAKQRAHERLRWEKWNEAIPEKIEEKEKLLFQMVRNGRISPEAAQRELRELKAELAKGPEHARKMREAENEVSGFCGCIIICLIIALYFYCR